MMKNILVTFFLIAGIQAALAQQGSIFMGYNHSFGAVDSSYVLGSSQNIDASYSVTLGRFLSNTGNSAFVLGTGISNANPLLNDISNSLSVGFSSDSATLFVSGGDGTSGSFGRVGVGTTSPAYALDVNGPIRSGREGTSGGILIYSEQGGTDYEYTIVPNAAATQNVLLTLPPDDGTVGQLLSTDGTGNLSWSSPTGFTASNGINIVSSDVRLGGTLTQNTIINQSGFDLSFQQNSSGITQNLELKNINNTTNVGAALSFGGTDGTISPVEVARINSVMVDNTGGAHAGDLVFSTANAGTLLEKMRLDAAGNLGIGTNNPAAKLEILGGAVLASGTVGATPVSGAGTRMMWIPDREAFRAGQATATSWDAANIGIRSVAFGFGTTANGTNSFAAGAYASSSALNSAAFGLSSSASGNNSFVAGHSVYAPSYAEAAFGAYNVNYTPVSTNALDPSDRVFSVGNGTSGSPSNALTILKSGNTGIGTDTPVNTLDVEGGVAIGSAYSGTSAASANGLAVEGQVGIGTVTPVNSKVEINSSGISFGLVIDHENNSVNSIGITSNSNITGTSDGRSIGISGRGYSATSSNASVVAGVEGLTGSNVTAQTLYGVYGRATSNSSGGTVTGVYGLADTKFGTDVKIGVRGRAENAVSYTGDVYGGEFTAVGAGGTNAYGLYATATGATNNYAAIFENGTVGIGNTNPVASLQIGDGAFTPQGDESVLIAGDGRDSYFETISTDMSEGLLMQGGGQHSGLIKQIASGGYMSGKPPGLHLFNKGNESLIISTNDTERMRVDGSGDVGIGTNTPNYSSYNKALTLSASESSGIAGTGAIEIQGNTIASFGSVARFRVTQPDASNNPLELFRMDFRQAGGDGFGSMEAYINNGTSPQKVIEFEPTGTLLVGGDNSDGFGALHVNDLNSATDGLDGLFLNVQNSSNGYLGTNPIMTGLRFKNTNWFSENYFKAGIFFRTTSNYGRGDLIFANQGLANDSNVDVDTDAVLTLKSTGEVGIGLSAPASKLNIYDADPFLVIQDSEVGSSSAQSWLTLAESGSGTTIGFNWNIGFEGNDLSFRYDAANGLGLGTELMFIQSDGDVYMPSLRSGLSGSNLLITSGGELFFVTSACPFLYIHDGNEFKLNSTILEGQAGKYKDKMHISEVALPEDRDHHKIMIKLEEPEITYLDFFALVVEDMETRDRDTLELLSASIDDINLINSLDSRYIQMQMGDSIMLAYSSSPLMSKEHRVFAYSSGYYDIDYKKYQEPAWEELKYEKFAKKFNDVDSAGNLINYRPTIIKNLKQYGYEEAESSLLVEGAATIQGSFEGEGLRVDNDGNVGIGNLSPSHLLSIGKQETFFNQAGRLYTGSSGALLPLSGDPMTLLNLQAKEENQSGLPVIDPSELNDIFPDLVIDQSIDYQALVPLLLEVIKEQKKQIDKQETDLNILGMKVQEIDELRSEINYIKQLLEQKAEK